MKLKERALVAVGEAGVLEIELLAAGGARDGLGRSG